MYKTLNESYHISVHLWFHFKLQVKVYETKQQQKKFIIQFNMTANVYNVLTFKINTHRLQVYSRKL